MNTLRLYAVLEDEPRNYTRRWRYRTQVLGSVLVWAGRANATHIVFDPELDEPFVYSDSRSNLVESEFPQPPLELKAKLRQSLFLDAIDGHPVLRPLRRLMRRLSRRSPRAILQAPDRERGVEYEWEMLVGPRLTTFELVGVSASRVWTDSG